jgi:hypothetical protein
VSPGSRGSGEVGANCCYLGALRRSLPLLFDLESRYSSSAIAMEVAGLALAIPPILTGFMKIVKSVDDIRTKYKTIPSSMDAIAAYCGMVHVSVLHLKSQQFQEALLSVPETTAQMMQHIEVLLLGCKGVLCQIEAYTVQFAERVSMRQRPGLDILQLTRLVWKESEVKDLLAQLRDYKSGIDTIRQICMRYVT